MTQTPCLFCTAVLDGVLHVQYGSKQWQYHCATVKINKGFNFEFISVNCQSGSHESRAQRLLIPKSPTFILIVETSGWLNNLHNLHYISNSAVAGWMQGSSPWIFLCSHFYSSPSSFHQSCAWNTSKLEQCPPEFSMTFLGHNDKSQHWTYVSYLDLKMSCMTFWLALTVICKLGAPVHVLKLSVCLWAKEILR